MSKGGMLFLSDDWYQLEHIKYKPDGTGRIKIISKLELRKSGIHSPDIADALMISCAGGIINGGQSFQKKKVALEVKRTRNRRFN